jgi:hypothetical protein
MPKQPKTTAHRAPTTKTVKELYWAVFRCGFKDCRKPLYRVNDDTGEHLLNSRVAHICARSAGGPRWDPGMSEDANRSAENLIPMCIDHADEIDRTPEHYPVELLREWKQAQLAERVAMQKAWELSDSQAREVLQASHVSTRQEAVDAYRKFLRAHSGRIDLSLLAEDLPPIVDKTLLECMQIRGDGHRFSSSLLPYLRRRRRMLLVGQPGSGKSVALREIAVHCLDHPHAPVPIRVSLPRLLRNLPEAWSLEKVVDQVAAESVVTSQQALLAGYLLDQAAAGNALLLVDGLDECDDRASWVAQQLCDVVDALPPQTGVVVSTRASAERAAARLDLPRAELEPPVNLMETVHRVLDTWARRRIPPAERDRWLENRRSWIAEAKSEHRALLEVPLLALLLALVCANASDSELPKGRAALLHRAVEDSVHRWEIQVRRPNPRPWTPELTADMLLDGFITLGRLLDGGLAPSQTDAVHALADRLQDPSQRSLPPAKAREVAREILRFWDEHVAVFVVTATGEVAARSKVFAEIATAKWATTCDTLQLSAWLSEALVYTDSDGAIALACDLDPRVMETLLDIGAGGRREATLMATELTARGLGVLSTSHLPRVLTQLADGAVASMEGERPQKRIPRAYSGSLPMAVFDRTREKGPWPFVHAASMLPLPIEHRQRRDELIVGSQLNRKQAMIATALCRLADASADARPLSPIEAELVDAVLNEPVPADEDSTLDEGGPNPTLDHAWIHDGLSEVALGAADHLETLSPRAAERAERIALDSSRRMADRIRSALERAGVALTSRYERLPSFQGEMTTFDRAEKTFLADLAALGEPSPNHDAGDLWSMPEVCDLVQSTKYASTGIHASDRAFRHDEPTLRRGWLDAMADAYGIDKMKISAQAHHMQEEVRQPEKSEGFLSSWHVAFEETSEPLPIRTDIDEALTDEQKYTLLESLEAQSPWIANAAANVLTNLQRTPWNSRDLLAESKSALPRTRAGLWHAVAILSAGPEAESLLIQAAASDDTDLRFAAWIALKTAPQLDPKSQVFRSLRLDGDLTARPEGDWDENSRPKFWSCRACGVHNKLADTICKDCGADAENPRSEWHQTD